MLTFEQFCLLMEFLKEPPLHGARRTQLSGMLSSLTPRLACHPMGTSPQGKAAKGFLAECRCCSLNLQVLQVFCRGGSPTAVGSGSQRQLSGFDEYLLWGPRCPVAESLDARGNETQTVRLAEDQKAKFCVVDIDRVLAG